MHRWLLVATTCHTSLKTYKWSQAHHLSTILIQLLKNCSITSLQRLEAQIHTKTEVSQCGIDSEMCCNFNILVMSLSSYNSQVGCECVEGLNECDA